MVQGGILESREFDGVMHGYEGNSSHSTAIFSTGEESSQAPESEKSQDREKKNEIPNKLCEQQNLVRVFMPLINYNHT